MEPRTAGPDRKAGLSGGAFPDRQRLKPAPGIRLLTAGLPSPFVHLRVGAVAPVLRRAADRTMHRHGGWVALRPRGPRSGPGYAVPVRRCLTGPIRPTRRPIATSPQGGLYAMPSLCGRAEATRERFRAFTTIPSGHAVLSDPGEFDIACVQCRDADAAFAEIRAARHSQHSRNPFHAGPGFRGFTGSHLLRPVRLLAPLDGLDQVFPATGGFYIQASDGSVTLPVAGYDYNSH